MSTRRVQASHLMSRGWQECMQAVIKSGVVHPNENTVAIR